MLVTMMIPFQALFYTTFNLPFGVFVMRNTFLQLPWELSEAAAVDGASATRTLLFVLRPLVVPGIATTVLYAFLFCSAALLHPRPGLGRGQGLATGPVHVARAGRHRLRLLGA